MTNKPLLDDGIIKNGYSIYSCTNKLVFFAPDEDEFWCVKKALAHKALFLLKGYFLLWYYRPLVDFCMPNLFLDKDGTIKSRNIGGIIGECPDIRVEETESFLIKTGKYGNEKRNDKVFFNNLIQMSDLDEKIPFNKKTSLLDSWDRNINLALSVNKNCSDDFYFQAIKIIKNQIRRESKEKSLPEGVTRLFLQGMNRVFECRRERDFGDSRKITFRDFVKVKKDLLIHIGHDRPLPDDGMILSFLNDRLTYGNTRARENFFLAMDEAKKENVENDLYFDLCQAPYV